MMTRRQAIKTTAIVSATVAVIPSAIAQSTPSASGGPFKLPPLPYAFDALEPYIDARTMEIHHDRHHKGYVDNLNKAVVQIPRLIGVTVEELLQTLNRVPEDSRAAIRNNGGGHYNHSLFWQMMKKSGGGEPKAGLAEAIEKNFGKFTGFKTEFAEAAMKVFGSGWAWLVLDGKDLKIETTPNQNSPISPSLLATEVNDNMGRKLTMIHPSRPPLLGLDVWEHAYYLKYQNKRADYIAAWWNVVNWDFVAERYAQLKG